MSYSTDVLDPTALEAIAHAQPLVTVPQAEVWRDLSRLGSGLGLAAVYGLGLGLRDGGLSLLRHAVGAPLGLLVVAGIAAPSLFVRLALVNAPLRPKQMLAAVSRSTFAAGLTLAGLAPAASMLVVSIQSRDAASLMSALGLWLAGGIGLLTFLGDMRAAVSGCELKLQGKVFFSVAVFALLALALSGRAWTAWLPLLGGTP